MASAPPNAIRLAYVVTLSDPRPWLAASFVALAIGGAGCFSSRSPNDDDSGRPVIDAGPRCTTDHDCTDGLFCTGRESCDPTDRRADSRGCVAGVPTCTDGLVCTVESTPACDEAAQQCNHVTIDHSLCPDGFYCRRIWGCTPADPCPADGSPCAPDGLECTAERCDTTMTTPRCVVDPLADGSPCTRSDGSPGACLSGGCS